MSQWKEKNELLIKTTPPPRWLVYSGRWEWGSPRSLHMTTLRGCPVSQHLQRPATRGRATLSLRYTPEQPYLSLTLPILCGSLCLDSMMMTTMLWNREYTMKGPAMPFWLVVLPICCPVLCVISRDERILDFLESDPNARNRRFIGAKL